MAAAAATTLKCVDADASSGGAGGTGAVPAHRSASGLLGGVLSARLCFETVAAFMPDYRDLCAMRAVCAAWKRAVTVLAVPAHPRTRVRDVGTMMEGWRRCFPCAAGLSLTSVCGGAAPPRRVDDRDMLLLAGMTSLTSLDVGLSDVSDGGLRRLLPTLPNLQLLDVHGCKRVRLQVAVDAAPMSTSLTTLVADMSAVSDVALAVFPLAFPALRTLRVPGCGGVTPRGHAGLAGLTSLTSLSMSVRRPSATEALASLPPLLALELHSPVSVGVAAAALAPLRRLTSLQSLKVALDDGVDAAAVAGVLAALTGLTTLVMDGIPGAAVASVARLPRLLTFGAWVGPMADEDIAVLGAAPHFKLQHLALRCGHRLAHGALEAIGAIGSLRTASIELRSRALRVDADAGPLVGDEALLSLRGLSGLTELRLSGNRWAVAAEGAAKLRAALPSLRQLVVPAPVAAPDAVER